MQANTRQPTFIFVHGSFCGAWCWKEVQASINAYGFHSLAIDLPGHGQDQTPRANISLSDYSRSLVCACTDEQVNDDIVLVGHSASGVVLTMAAPRIRTTTKVTQLIFVSGILRDTGQALIDRVPPQRQDKYRTLAKASQDNSFLLPEMRSGKLGPQLNPEPMHAYSEPYPGDEFNPLDYTTTYIACENDIVLRREEQLHWCEQLGITPTYMLGCGHSPMFDCPQELANNLAACVTAKT